MSRNKQALVETSKQSDDSSPFYLAPPSTSTPTSRSRRTREGSMKAATGKIPRMIGITYCIKITLKIQKHDYCDGPDAGPDGAKKRWGQDIHDEGIHISGPQHYPICNPTAFSPLPQAMNLGGMVAPSSGISPRTT